MVITDKYVFFWGGILSQWHKASFNDSNGTEYNCAEQYMMYMKAMYFEDCVIGNDILKSKDPREQKALGRKVKGFTEQKWIPMRELIAYHGNLYKFNQNPGLKQQLIDTGDRILVEASPYDVIWGIGLGEGDVRIYDEKNWRGLNLLGKALMKVRDKLRST